MLDEMARLTDALARSGGASSDFDLNPGFQPLAQTLRPAAVLVGVMADPNGARVILTKRASHLKHHPGQIAFPGGKQEDSDADPEAAALREAQEEIGLHPQAVTVLGRLGSHETVTGFQITPVLAHINGAFIPAADPQEVEEIFSVPLAHVLDPQRYVVEGRQWRGQFRRYYAVPWGPYYIWGATARILRGLAERVAQ